MELWIRSQDKEKLCEIKYIRYMNMSENYEEDIHSLWNDSLGILGTYATKERALEVLDEIQRLIEDLQYISYAIENEKFSGYRPNVYQMPKE